MKHATQHKSGGGGGTVRYLEVPDNVAIDKVKQGFRHQVKQANQSNKPGSGETLIQKIKHTKPSQRSPIVMGTEKATRTVNGLCPPPGIWVEGMVAPSMLACPPVINRKLQGWGEHMSTRAGNLDHLYYGLPRSTLLYSDNRWLDPLSPLLTVPMPAPLFRRNPLILPSQHPLFPPFSSFTRGLGNTRGLEWDPHVMNLLALRFERPCMGTVQHDLPVMKKTSEGP